MKRKTPDRIGIGLMGRDTKCVSVFMAVLAIQMKEEIGNYGVREQNHIIKGNFLGVPEIRTFNM